jgi:RNA polymerase sigma factor (sigma-70 family)
MGEGIKRGDVLLFDSEIIDLFNERSEKAIMELSKKYGSVCRKVARNILNNDLDAEECVNDAFLGAWNTIPPQNPTPLLTYICRIVRNLSIKKYHANTAIKRNSFYDAALDELEECLASAANVETELAAKELTLLLDSFLDTLDKENRMMFVRRYWYSDSIPDIAARFQIRSNNVTVRLFRIRKKLQNYLRKAGFEI